MNVTHTNTIQGKRRTQYKRGEMKQTRKIIILKTE